MVGMAISFGRSSFRAGLPDRPLRRDDRNQVVAVEVEQRLDQFATHTRAAVTERVHAQCECETDVLIRAVTTHVGYQYY